MTQMVKNLPAMQENWVQSLGQEDSLEKGMATHSLFLPGELHGQRSLAGYSLWGCRELGPTFTFFLGTKLCTSFGAGRVGRVGGRTGRKKPNSKTIILAFGFVMMLNLPLLYFCFTHVKYFCLK